MASNDKDTLPAPPASNDKDIPPVPAPLVEKPPQQVEVDADEVIPHPTLELYRHTLLRGANLGSFVALVIGPPILFFRGVRKPGEMFRRLASFCAKGTGIGIALGAIMTIIRTRGNTEEQIYDRAYRLRYNKGQVRMDKFSYGFALVGGAAGAAGFPVGGVAGAVQGASLGLGLSVLGHVLTKPKEKES